MTCRQIRPYIRGLSALTLICIGAISCTPAPETSPTTPITETSLSISSPTPTAAAASGLPTPETEQKAPIRSTLPRCYYPSDAVMTPDSRWIYIPCYATSNVILIDTTTDRPTSVIDLSSAHQLGMHVYDAAITPDGKKLYLGDDMMDVIAVIDTDSNEISEVIDFGRDGAVNAVAISPDGALALVAFEGGNSVGIINVPSDTVQGYFEAQEDEFFYLVGISSDGREAYVVSRLHGGRIYVIGLPNYDVLDIVGLDITGNLHPQATMAVSPDDHYLYLTSGFNDGGTENPDLGTNRLVVIDLEERRKVDEVAIMGGPQRITLSADGRIGYVSTFSGARVVVVDLVERTIVGEFDWGSLYTGQLEGMRYDLRQVLLHPDAKRGYLVGWDGGILALLDLENLTVSAAIELNPIYGAEPVDILILPDGGKAYLPTWGRYPPNTQNAIAVVDLHSGKVEQRIRIDGEPMKLSMSADSKFLYIPTGSSFVAVVDTTTDEQIGTIVPGPEPHFFTDSAVLDRMNKLYVSYANQTGGGGVYVIDMATETTIADIMVESPVASLDLSLDGLHLYGSRMLDPEGLLIISTNTDQVEGSVPPPEGTNYPEVGVFASLLGVSPDDLHLFWGTGPSFVNVLDIRHNQVLRSIDFFEEILTGLPIAPAGMAFSPDGSLAYITCLDAGYLVVWDTVAGEAIATVRVGVNPLAAATSPDGSRIFVANMRSEDISIIDQESMSIVGSISLGSLP